MRRHVPVPRPTDQPKGDKPPKIKEKKPLPPVMAGSGSSLPRGGHTVKTKGMKKLG